MTEPYGDMIYMRTAAVRALDGFSGQTISDRALEATARVARMRRALIVVDDYLARHDPDINAGRGPTSVSGIRLLIDDALDRELIR